MPLFPPLPFPRLPLRRRAATRSLPDATAAGDAWRDCPHEQAVRACALALARVRPPELADVLASHADAA